MSDKYTNARKVFLPNLPPQTLIEARDSIVRIRSTFTIRYPIEEVAVVCPLSPHPFHLVSTGLEVSEILLPNPWFLIDLYLTSTEW